MAQASLLANPLATPEQLEASSSSYDGIPEELERSVRYAGARLTQSAGVLLRLPQDVVAAAIVLFTRFWIGADGGSLREHGAKDISAASVSLITKLSAHPKSPRSIINVYSYLLSPHSPLLSAADTFKSTNDPESYVVSEGTYQRERTRLSTHETVILRALGFQTHVALPHRLCINYLQALEVFQADADAGKKVARRAFAHLNTALLSPQLLYVTHQPPALATAAVYLAARECGFKLPEEPWWEVFDTDREQLGFLVVGMLSMEGFAKEEQKHWEGRTVPMTVEEIEAEMRRRNEMGE